ncbi:Peptidyl-prolyl cis-trans isomerase FKBP20-2, chloroplastic [Capsicum annuum]|nr:Peptidyl-prolyl cis-trans isomerase FKBP20-2, chloroplastic [Capsicum annuum]
MTSVEHHEVSGSITSLDKTLGDFFPSVLALVDKITLYLLLVGGGRVKEQKVNILHYEDNMKRRSLLFFLITSGISPALPAFGKTKSKNPYDERRLLEQNKRIQRENNAPEEFPSFVREGFTVKVVTSDNYVKRDSGLILWDFAVGEGDCPKDGQQVTFHYVGYNESGRRIDSTYLQGSPAKIRMGTKALVPGFEEGIRDMRPGGKRRIIIPPELGPPVGPSTFFSSKQFEVFDVELLDVQDCKRRTIGFYSDETILQFLYRIKVSPFEPKSLLCLSLGGSRASSKIVEVLATVNIMPRTVLKRLGISIDELSQSNITIQGFNQGGQRAVGKISIELSIGNMKSNILIHVIDAKTSYNLLLGRPWLRENGVVTSTLHQCMKYIKDSEVVKVDADINPFTETESYFADAKFYLDSRELDVKKPTPSSPIGVNSKEEIGVQTGVAKMSKERTEGITIKFSGDVKPKTTNEQVVFRYIPRERRRDGQPLLEACTQQVLHPRKEMSHEMYQDLKKKPLRISTRKVKETTSSHHISAEEEKKGEDEKTPQRTSVFYRIGKSIPRVSVFDRLGGKDRSGASNWIEGCVTTMNASVFLRLGTAEKPSSRKTLSEHEQ